MKKLMLKLATIFCLFLAVSFSAQAQFMEKGDVLGSGGFYFPSGLTLLNFGVDFGVADNVSVGGRFITVLSKGSTGSYIGGRVAYHLGEAFGVRDTRSLDPYAAFQAGKVLSGDGGFGLNIPLGLRFMFNEKFGAYAEYMIDLNSEALGNQFGLGISFRFNN